MPQRPDFHPKRNQARQKLATLPKIRFRDLASDVYFELERRYPEFSEPQIIENVNEINGNVMQAHPRQNSQSQQQQRSLPPQFPTSQRRPQFPNGNPNAPSGSTGVANEMIIPNKSTLVEEDVGMPSSTSADTLNASRNQVSANKSYQYAPPPRKSSERDRDRIDNTKTSPKSYEKQPSSPNLTNDENANYSPQTSRGRRSNEGSRQGVTAASPTDWNTSHSRASEASSIGTRLIGGYGGQSGNANTNGAERGEWESEKSAYEYKLATMQNRLHGLERDLESANDGRRVS